MEKSNNVDVIYLDFAKAFEKVDHRILLNKLKKIGINGKIGVLIHNFLSNRQQCVAINRTTSSEAQVRSSGVPQGSVLGPLLFLIHISDINYEMEDSTVSCFANDTQILLGIKDEEDTQMLQNDSRKLYKWAETNNMKSNANKFELLRYGKEQEIKSAKTYKSYDDSNINDKEQIRDLGIMKSNKATFTLHIRNIGKKARDKMGWVLRVFQSWARSLMRILLKSLVIPLLEYCCQLWNPWKEKDIQAIEAIQRTFAYKITEVQHLNNWERLHELKLYSLQRRRESYIIIYIFGR